ncbi:MAG: V-type ATPase 116kDa subunit family protein [Candidatus Micrarchaeota archaeon]
MLSTEPMEKVRMLFSNRIKDKVIAYLHDNGFIEIRKSKLSLNDDAPSTELNELSELLLRVNGSIEIINEHIEKRRAKQKMHMLKRLERNKLIRKLTHFKPIERLFELDNIIKESEKEIESLEHAKYIASNFIGIAIDFSKLKSDYISYKAYIVAKKNADALEASLNKINNLYLIKNDVGKDKNLFFIAYEKGLNIDEAIKGIALEELDLSDRYLDSKPEHVVEKCNKEIDRLKEQISKAANEIREMNRYMNELLAYREMLEIEIERESIKSNFKKTDYTFLIEGWIPKKKLSDIRNGLSRLTDEFELEVIEKEEDELPPTLTNRPKFLKPFDYMMEFYSIPRSDEVDPTWIFILSFPIFYGMMVSDVGYGIASLLFVTWITTFTDPDGLVYNAAKIWQLAAFSAIFFGFLSNQYFGYQLNQYFGINFGIDWIKNVTTVLLVTILFGIAQVSLGLLLGFVNKWRHGEKKVAISKLTGILTIITGVFAVGGAFFNLVGAGATLYFGIASIVSLIATGALSGIEATEITSLIAHPLSYARILGFGMSSIIIAMLIDQAFTPSLSHGILLFILFLIIFVTLHFLNMTLGIFEGLVQGIRLNFVEFFSKFYNGGGIKFKPFYYKRKYVKD